MNSNKITIMVSGASGIVGYGSLKNLKKTEKYHLIGTALKTGTPAEIFSDVFELAPKTTDASYFPWLKSIIEKYKIDMLIPAIELDVIEWNKNRQFFKELGVFALLNNPKLIELCSDKWLFYQEIKDTPYAIPTRLDDDFDQISKTYGLPFFVKPRCGYASHGTAKIETKEQFIDLKLKTERLMSQPLIGNNEEEYTISGFFTQESQLVDLICLKRKLATEGFTGTAEVYFLPEAWQALEDLAAILKPVGPTNFQFRKNTDGQLKLLEINPRVSSATSIRCIFGYNEQQMSVEYFLEQKIPQKSIIQQGKVIRYIEDYKLVK